MNQPQPMKKIKERFQSELKEKFNETKFDEDVKSGKDISLDHLNEYRIKEKELIIPHNKDDDKNKVFNKNGLSFRGYFKNGEYVAIGSNGHIIKSKNMDDFHRQLAQVFKLHALKNGKEPECTLKVGKNEANKQKLMESFARNFINAGVVVKGDLPKSPEFWKKMKANYLAQKGHTLENWNRLTRFVPAEYMRSQEKISQYQAGVKQKPITQKRIAPSMIAHKGRSGR